MNQASEASRNDYIGIGQLAQRARVSNRTIRYYEELGILPKPPRSSGGTRKYPPEYVFYIEGALALKGLGFSLDEIKLLGRLALGQAMTPQQRAHTSEILLEKMSGLEHRIGVLSKLRDVLRHGSDDAHVLSLDLLRQPRRTQGSPEARKSSERAS